MRRLLSAAVLVGALCGAQPLRILVVNDDGYQAPGIRILRTTLKQAGHQVTVVAPKTDQSGKGTSFFTKVGAKLDVGYDAKEDAWWVDGTPVDAARVGLEVVLKDARPDVVLSGINRGENLGEFANSSGTVGAAVWAFTRGVPAIALSAGMKIDEALSGFPSTTRAMQQAGELAARLLRTLPPSKFPRHAGLNINVPAIGNPLPPVLTLLSRGYNNLEIGLRAGPDFGPQGGPVSFVFKSVPAPARPDARYDADSFAAGHTTITWLDGDWSESGRAGRRLLKGVVP
jgi:5'/3'-nucleotidase SurE